MLQQIYHVPTGVRCAVINQFVSSLEPSDDLNDLNFFNQKKKKKKSKKVFDNDIEESFKVSRCYTQSSFPSFSLSLVVCVFLSVYSLYISTYCSSSTVVFSWLSFISSCSLLMMFSLNIAFDCLKSGAENRRRADGGAGGRQPGPDASCQKEEVKESGL